MHVPLKKIVLISLTVITGVILYGCREEEKVYFKGEIIIIDKFDKEISLNGKRVELNNIYEGRPFVCDSFLIFNSYKCPNYWLYAFDIKTGEYITSFCSKGEGPDDYLSCDESVQVIREDGESKIWVRDYNKNNLHLINITQSIRQQKTICDSVMTYEWSKHFEYPLLGMFFLNNGNILGINQCEKKFLVGKDYIPRDLYLFKDSLGGRKEAYHLYKCPVIYKNDNIDFSHDAFYSGAYRIKPDNTKLGIAMEMLAQISIVDIKTGDQKNYRLKNSLTFQDIEKDIYKSRVYYATMAVSNRNIFALYVDAPMKEVTYPYKSHTIHVLSWKGDPVCKINVSESIMYIAVDEFSQILYAIDTKDNLYAYDISKI